jgi:hypothetical protein
MTDRSSGRRRRIAAAWFGLLTATLLFALYGVALSALRNDPAGAGLAPLALSEPVSAAKCPPAGHGRGLGTTVQVHRDTNGLIYGEIVEPNGRPILSVCFAPGTDPQYVEDFMRRMMMQELGAWPRPPGQDYWLDSSWSATPATPRRLSWSFVPDGTTIPSYGLGAQAASSIFATLNSQFAAHGGQATWIRHFTNVFARWGELSGLTFRRVMHQGQQWDDGASFDAASGGAARGDLRIAMRPIDGVWNILAFNFFPGAGAGGNMVIDSAEIWGGQTANSHRFFRNVVSHEVGHGIGFLHVCPANQTKLMEPFLSTAFDGPQHDDNRGVVENYGDPYETNDTAATASPLGTVIQGAPLAGADDAPLPLVGPAVAHLSTMAIETNGEVDWYRFSTNGAATVTILLIPVGHVYDDQPQGATCPSGNTINSAAIANLDMELYSGGGATLLATASSQPAGSTEQIVQAVGAAGEYHIRVFESTSALRSQLYRLEISVAGGSATNTAPTAVADTYTVLEDNALAVDRPGVLANDADPEGQFLVALPVTSVPAAAGLMNFSSQGSFDFVPAQHFNGSTSFTYRVGDGTFTSAPATVTINVTPVNDRPTITLGANQVVNEDSGPVTVPGWATNITAGPPDEAGQTVTVTATNNNTGLFSVQPAVASNGALSFTPAANLHGTATVTVTAHDNGGTANGGLNASLPQTFVITVNSVNDAPSFVAGPNQVVNEDSGARSVPNWATGISRGPANEAGQTVSFVTTNDNNALFSAQPAVSATGTLTFTPAANRFGVATVSARITDNGGTANGGVDTSAPQTFTITISPVNDAPSFTAGANQTVNEDSGPQHVPSWATGISAGPFETQGLTFEVVSNSNPALFSAQPAVSPAGALTHTPAPNANGAATIEVRLRDDGGVANGGMDVSPSQAFTIVVTPVNDPPFLQPIGDRVATVGQPLTFSAVASDPHDVPPNALAFSLDAGAPSGAAIGAATGAFAWTPSPGQEGVQTLTIRVTDDGVQPMSDFETITITVNHGTVNVSGNVGLLGWTFAPLSEPLITFEVRSPGSTAPLQSTAVHLSATGDFTFVTALPPGTYDVTAKGDRWLRARLQNVTLTAAGASGLNFGELVPGDVHEDNVIDLGDFLIMASTYEAVPPTEPRADLNGDDLVDLSDFLLLAAAYEMVGAP